MNVEGIEPVINGFEEKLTSREVEVMPEPVSILLGMFPDSWLPEKSKM